MSLQSPVMNIMVKAAEKAARSLLRDFNEVEKLQVTQKAHGEFVSKADIRAEEIIQDTLLYARPDHALLMEESGAHNEGQSDFTFIVVPLDGTTNFLYGIPHWCISIALHEGNQPVAGLIFDPIREEIYQAERNKGAFMNQQRLQVSGRTDTRIATVAHGSAQQIAGANKKEFLAQVGAMHERFSAVRHMGSAALNLAYVASGSFDGYWSRNVKPWDIAAGALMVMEARGKVSDFSLHKDHIKRGEIIAGNRTMHEVLAKTLAKSSD